MSELDGRAIVYCDGAFNTPNGKTAHGLVRFTRRYEVAAVIDRRHAGSDAREVLDGRAGGIPVVEDLDAALRACPDATHLVIGLAPDGGRLPAEARATVAKALEQGLNVDSGMHDFLSEDPDLVALAEAAGVRIRDVRRPPDRSGLHGFSGRIEQVESLIVALLGTDSAVGKRTTAWLLVDALRARGRSAEMIGTGQTAWMQGVRYGIVLDSLINDFVAGELEHAVLRAWDERRPDALIVEGQGSLMNPAYPGGFEILAATRPDSIVLQHAPSRSEYDGFPGYAMHPLATQIAAHELIGGRKVVAITLNHEGLARAQVPEVCARIQDETGLPTVAPLLQPLDPVVDAVLGHRHGRR